MASLDPVSAALADAAVRAAVDRQVDLAVAGQREAETAWWVGTRAEVLRLRALVAEQSRRIAELEAAVARLESELSSVEVAEVVAAIAEGVARADLALEAYAVSRARIDVKAAVQVSGDRVLVAGDPGNLLSPWALSTVSVTLGALPPPPGTGS